MYKQNQNIKFSTRFSVELCRGKFLKYTCGKDHTTTTCCNRIWQRCRLVLEICPSFCFYVVYLWPNISYLPISTTKFPREFHCLCGRTWLHLKIKTKTNFQFHLISLQLNNALVKIYKIISLIWLIVLVMVAIVTWRTEKLELVKLQNHPITSISRRSSEAIVKQRQYRLIFNEAANEIECCTCTSAGSTCLPCRYTYNRSFTSYNTWKHGFFLFPKKLSTMSKYICPNIWDET